MSILDDLLATLPDDAAVRSVLVGAHWTVVCSRGCGLASTITGDKPHGQAQVRDVGRLHLKSARELAEYARSDNPLEAGIGLAAINSLLDVDERNAVEINAADVLAGRGRGKAVVLVGHFPFIPQLREQVGQLCHHRQRAHQPHARWAARALPARVAGDGVGTEHAAFAGVVRARRDDSLRRARRGRGGGAAHRRPGCHVPAGGGRTAADAAARENVKRTV